MLLVVYCEHGFVGVYSSIELVRELVYANYQFITFVTYVFSNAITNVESNEAWVVYYKDSENIAYVSQIKEESEHVMKMLQILKKGYNDSIDYWKTELNTIPDIINNILKTINGIAKDIRKEIVDNTDNIIMY
jgi:hypothetical protein